MLCYIKHTFQQINKIKVVFKNACQTDTMIAINKNWHRNFPK